MRNFLHKDKVAKAEVEKKRRAQEDERRRLMEGRRKAEEAKRAKDGPYERKEDWAEEDKARGEVMVCDSESVTVSALRICMCLGELWMLVSGFLVTAFDVLMCACTKRFQTR